MFKTDQKIDFRFDDKRTNFLYMNGVIDQEVVDETKRYMKFPSPFVQKRLFSYFSYELFQHVGQLHPPLESLEDTITDESLNVKNLMRLYQTYFPKKPGLVIEGCTSPEDRFTHPWGRLSF